MASAICDFWKKLIGDQLIIEKVRGPELSDKMVGETERKLKVLLSIPKEDKNKTKLVVIDEIDSFIPVRESGENNALANKIVG